MKPEQYVRVRSLFDVVAGLPTSERVARLKSLGTDEATIAEVLELVDANQQNSTTAFAASLRDIVSAAVAPTIAIGDTVGVWRVLRSIGEGGMGSVYLVERNDGHFTQTAALKLLKGLASSGRLDYFARERQLLANLTHPNIARLLDGGSTHAGQPWLVMELVDGVPIDVYCRQQKLAVAQILKLFSVSCDAVSFSHRQLIVHCDLKPSNLLVNRDGRPVLLDFGIARLDSATNEDKQTPIGFTPRYASPEQREHGNVSTLSDIYSLGVLLEELLADKCRGDTELSAIVAKARAIDAAARYVSVDALTQDIVRYLARIPLDAMPYSIGYLGKKFFQRRWPLVLAGVAFAATVAGFTIKVVIESARAKDAEAQALQEAAAAKRVSEFVESIFFAADPDNTGRQDITAFTLVERGKERIATELNDVPAVQARLYEQLAFVYEKIGRPIEAADMYDRAIAVARAIKPVQPDKLSSLLIHSALFISNNKLPGPAIAHARESLAMREKFYGPVSHHTAQSADMLALILSADGQIEEAEPLMTRALAIRELRTGNAVEDDIASSHHNLGTLARRKGDFATAADKYAIAVEMQEKRVGVRHPRYLNSLERQAQSLAQVGRAEQAEAMLRRSLEIRREIHGAKSSRVALALSELAIALAMQGKHRAAIPLFREALAISATAHGSRSPVYAATLGSMASSLEQAGAAAEAQTALTEALSICVERLDANDLSTAEARHNLGKYWLRKGDLSRAAPLLLEAKRVRVKKLPTGNVFVKQSVTAVDELNRLRRTAS